MKCLAGYVKRNIIWIFLIGIIAVVHLGYMFLVNVGLEDIAYAAFLDCILLALFFMIDFIRYKSKVKKLQKILCYPVEEQRNLPEPEDDIEMEYRCIVENHDIARTKAVSQLQKTQSETMEYYARWVHQIKTPISAMRLLLKEQKDSLGELMEEAENNQSTYMRIYDTISDQEDELFRIEEYVNVVLQYQRINSSSNDYVLANTKLDMIIRNVIRKYAKTMIRKHLQIKYEGAGQMVYTDAKWIEFVLEQILSNAIKYTNKGTICIETLNEPNWCYIRITDSGIGIEADDLPRIFENGYTGYNGRTGNKSTGIGLYICKQIIDRLGHSIRVESQVGKGTTVWIGFCTKNIDARD